MKNRATHLLLASWALSLMVAGCSRPRQPTCLDRRQQARNAALQGRLEEASELIDEVEKNCDANSQSQVRHVRKLIAEKTRARQEREKRDRDTQEKRDSLPTERFVAWATAQPGRATSEVQQTECAPRGDPAFGFCQAHAPDAPNMTLRYWNDQPQAYLYSLETTLPLSCRDLIDYRQIRAWSADGKRLELCELTGRKLRHVSALLEFGDGGNRMHIFSQLYLGHDAEFEGRLRVRR